VEAAVRTKASELAPKRRAGREIWAGTVFFIAGPCAAHPWIFQEK
jgi:hypothetical protein